MSFRTVIWTRNRWIYWNRTFLGLAMANLVRHNINKKSWDIMMKLGGHVLRSPGRSTWSLWSWSRCQMKNTLEIFIISKDRVLSLINCPFTTRRIFQTLRMWFSGSNFGRSLPYKYSNLSTGYILTISYVFAAILAPITETLTKSRLFFNEIAAIS